MLGSLCGSVVFNIADHQPQRLEGGFIVSELHPVASSFTQLVVKRLNGIRRIDDLPCLGLPANRGHVVKLLRG